MNLHESLISTRNVETEKAKASAKSHEQKKKGYRK